MHWQACGTCAGSGTIHLCALADAGSLAPAHAGQRTRGSPALCASAYVTGLPMAGAAARCSSATGSGSPSTQPRSSCNMVPVGMGVRAGAATVVLPGVAWVRAERHAVACSGTGTIRPSHAYDEDGAAHHHSDVHALILLPLPLRLSCTELLP